ncbi:hypothetical protein MSI_15540 [Treponema sp. JC4]|uniref:GNAT family N-acetyltransferase n=1 Tax=Treponema sp. JC4 TaxID=1124982 RepID=UPI00025B0A9D|nr:GNAT family N-acetyltransferase [Treponema sp. JC4]EID84958.1 hypothetical protein MSI_15540 [Treponema sp. JC4]
MQIINYFDYDDKTSIISQLEILQGEWRAIGFLLSLLKEESFHEKLGNGFLYILLDEDKITNGKPTVASFVTFCDRDEVISEFRPWIGFVFTTPVYRGRRLAGKIIEHCMKVAETAYPESEYVYVSTDEEGLYEKYGFDFFEKMKTVWGEESRVYRRKNKC